jgi:hypothetical protein
VFTERDETSLDVRIENEQKKKFIINETSGSRDFVVVSIARQQSNRTRWPAKDGGMEMLYLDMPRHAATVREVGVVARARSGATHLVALFALESLHLLVEQVAHRPVKDVVAVHVVVHLFVIRLFAATAAVAVHESTHLFVVWLLGWGVAEEDDLR